MCDELGNDLHMQARPRPPSGLLPPPVPPPALSDLSLRSLQHRHHPHLHPCHHLSSTLATTCTCGGGGALHHHVHVARRTSRRRATPSCARSPTAPAAATRSSSSSRSGRARAPRTSPRRRTACALAAPCTSPPSAPPPRGAQSTRLRAEGPRRGGRRCIGSTAWPPRACAPSSRGARSLRPLAPRPEQASAIPRPHHAPLEPPTSPPLPILAPTPRRRCALASQLGAAASRHPQANEAQGGALRER